MDDYETQKPQPRHPKEFLLPARIRQRMLLNEWDCTISSIAKAIQEVKVIKNHRERAAKKTSRITKVEKVRSQLSRLRKIKKNILKKNSKVSENTTRSDSRRGSNVEIRGILKKSGSSLSPFYIEDPSLERNPLTSIWSCNDDIDMSNKHGVKVL